MRLAIHFAARTRHIQHAIKILALLVLNHTGQYRPIIFLRERLDARFKFIRQGTGEHGQGRFRHDNKPRVTGLSQAQIVHQGALHHVWRPL